MSIATRADLIARLQEEKNPDEILVYTYWGDSDFENYQDKDQAYNLVNEALNTAIGHVNEYLESQYKNEGK